MPASSALIVGLGLFGTALGTRLVELGWEVAGIDRAEEAVAAARDTLQHVVQLDASDEEALATVDVPSFDVCVVTSGEDVERSLLLVLNLQGLGARSVVAKAGSEYHARILRRLGVEQVVFPERDSGMLVAERLQAPHLVQWIDLATADELGVITVPEEHAGKSLGEWRAFQRAKIQLVGHLSPSGRMLSRTPECRLEVGEMLIVVGPLREILSIAR